MSENENKKGFNMAVEDLETAIYNVINESGLPLAVSKMVLDRVAVNVNNQLALAIKDERQQYAENAKKEGE